MESPSENAAWEDDEDWGWHVDGPDGECGASDTDDEEVVRQAGGPIVCEQLGSLKRLRIDDSRPATVRLPQYRLSACCCACGRRDSSAGPLASLYDNVGFASMAEVMEEVLGLVFEQSANKHENLLCAGCRGHLLALHTMRSWLIALQRRYVRMVVRTNAGRRSAKVMMPKQYKHVDFFRLDKPVLEVAGQGELGSNTDVVVEGECSAVRQNTNSSLPVHRSSSEPVQTQAVSDDLRTAGQTLGTSSDAGGPATADGDPSGTKPPTPSGGSDMSAGAPKQPTPARSQMAAETPSQPTAAQSAAGTPQPDPETRRDLAAGGAKSDTDVFEEFNISDLLVLRSPPPEKPVCGRPVRIAPKLDRKEQPLVPQTPAPIVLNILPVPAAATPSAAVTATPAAPPGFKAIVPRSGPSTLLKEEKRPERRTAPPAQGRPAKTCRQEAPVELAAGDGVSFTSMVYYNPDGSIPAPPFEPAQPSEPGAEYPQLQTLELAASQFREQQAGARPVDVQRQIDQLSAACVDYPAAEVRAAAAGGGSSSADAPQVPVKADDAAGKSERFQLVPPACKLCFQAMGMEMAAARKHFVSWHMDLTRNNLKGITVYSCRGCKLESPSLERLAKHFETRHVSRSAFVCDRCGWRFPRVELLRAHLRHTHKPAGRLVCEHCGSVYLTPRTMAAHMNKVHPSVARAS